MLKPLLMNSLTPSLLGDSQCATAWQWLCDSRKGFPPNADIWHLRFHRHSLLPRIHDDIKAGRYRFNPMQIVTCANGEEIALWSAADAYVLKLLTLTLQGILPVHRSCTHVKGHGGHKATVQQTHNWVAGGAYSFICKTDIRGYYANIDKTQLFTLLERHVHCPIILNLLYQFLHYSVEQGGNFHEPRLGIPRGCALSPLLAGFHLYALDQDLSKRKQVRYLRFMDDLIILTRTRWQLKRAVATMNQWFADAGLQQHPDKTFIGRLNHGFDWLGYHFNEYGVCRAAASAIKQANTKLHRLLEQARRLPPKKQVAARQRAVDYVTRWQRWLNAGITIGSQPNWLGQLS